MNQYLAITLGPIYATLSQARKTRELWAGSFLFSQMMELLIDKIGEDKVILPKRVQAKKAERYGAGIYNDRLFAEAGTLSDDAIETLIDECLEALAAKLCPEGASPDASFWKQYLRIEWVRLSLANIQNGHLIKAFSPYLDTAECRQPFFAEEPVQNAFLQLLDNPYTTSIASFLKGSSRGVYAKMIEPRGLFPSTFDFATYELFQYDASGYQNLLQLASITSDSGDEQMDKSIQQFYELLGSDKPENVFKTVATDYHRYFCIVHADGDRIGATIETLADRDAYSGFSEKLGQYAIQAAGIINDYGGKPVYIGGDDLLFFAPVCVRKGDTTVSIFQLISALDKAFQELGLPSSPSLSFGLTFTYHKYPLFEAYSASYKQLAFRAKKVAWGPKNKKNAVSFRLIKHSGSWYEGILTKTQLQALSDAEKALRQADRDLLSSIIYKLDTLEPLLKQLDSEGRLTTQLHDLFHNFFNEPIHRRNQRQLDLLEHLTDIVFRQSATVDETPLDRSANLYATLRMLKFITDKP